MTAGIQTLSVFKAPIPHHYTILLPNGHHGVWHIMDAENIFVKRLKMNDLWLDYPDKKQFGTHSFLRFQVVKDHACEVTVKFFAMNLENIFLSWKSGKKGWGVSLR